MIAFVRYSVAAISLQHISLPFVVCHIQLVLRISMDESALIAVMYDEIQRKTWARRASKGETFELDLEARTKSEESLDLAKSKAKVVAKAAGLKPHETDRSSDSGQKWQDAESALSKQVQLAETVTKNAEKAMRSLNETKQHTTFVPYKGKGFKGKGKHDNRGGKRAWQGGQGGGQSWKKKKGHWR